MLRKNGAVLCDKLELGGLKIGAVNKILCHFIFTEIQLSEIKYKLIIAGRK